MPPKSHRYKSRSRDYHIDVPNITPGEEPPIHVPEHAHPTHIYVTGYGPEGYEEAHLTNTDDIFRLAKKWPVVWVDIDGLGNKELNEAMAHAFGLDKLVLEDIFDTSHFPKVEEYENYIFMILKNGLARESFATEQISMILTEKVVLTFQECPGDSFLQLRRRIMNNGGRIRQFGTDYLAYAIIDAVVESYYPVLAGIKCKLDALEDTFTEISSRGLIRQIHDIKNDLLFLHSAIWPIHDITIVLAHDDTPIVTEATGHYLRDCQDQAKRVTELSEFYRHIASDLMATHIAYSDNKANEVMKTLTMVATIFIPLSFIVGLYGMNFDTAASPYNMPELHFRYGYPMVLGLMLSVVIGFLIMFWRRGWFKSD